MPTPIGHNVWYDLMTSDEAAAARFYGEAIGWKTQVFEGGDPSQPYTLWLAGAQPVGGYMALPEAARQMGAGPHWLAYTAVEDVSAASAQAESLGGRILKSATEIPTVGSFAVLADPQGAVFAVFRGADEMEAPSPGDQPGHFSWCDLNTTDHAAAFAFYQALFGWTATESMEVEGIGTYAMFQDRSGATRGGMCSAAKALNLPPHWLHYITVDSAQAAADRVLRGGGQVVKGPHGVPGGGQIAQCLDPQGAAFAVYAPPA